MSTATRTRIRNFGSRETEARIAARVASDYTPTAWAADMVAARANRQEATVTKQAVTRETADKLIAASATHTPWVPEATIWEWLPTVTEPVALAKLAWVEAQPVADTFNTEWAAMKNEAAEQERRQEEAAYEAKYSRDEHLLKGGRKLDRQQADIPAGRYAVDGEDGATKFYRVDRPTEGKWKGYTFVKVQAGDELHNVRSKATREAVLAKIAEAGVEQAMLRYGREIGACGHCGRTLTNEESRELGIGPICRSKMGF